RVVQTRHADTEETVEDRVREGELDRGAERRGQVRVVHPLAVAPREAAVRTGDRADGDGRVTERDQLVLEIPGQGVNRSHLTLAGCRRVTRGSGPAGVGGLGPRVSGVE